MRVIPTQLTKAQRGKSMKPKGGPRLEKTAAVFAKEREAKLKGWWNCPRGVWLRNETLPTRLPKHLPESQRGLFSRDGAALSTRKRFHLLFKLLSTMFAGTCPPWDKHLFPEQSIPRAGPHLHRYGAIILKDQREFL